MNTKINVYNENNELIRTYIGDGIYVTDTYNGRQRSMLCIKKGVGFRDDIAFIPPKYIVEVESYIEKETSSDLVKYIKDDV